MLTDPQTVTLLTVSTALAKVPGPSNGSKYRYQAADGTTMYELIPTFTDNGRRRKCIVRLNAQKVAADPLDTGAYIPVQMSVVFTIDYPAVGYAPADVAMLAGDMVNYLDTAGLLAKIVGGET